MVSRFGIRIGSGQRNRKEDVVAVVVIREIVLMVEAVEEGAKEVAGAVEAEVLDEGVAASVS
jgi:hypothetical protein